MNFDSLAPVQSYGAPKQASNQNYAQTPIVSRNVATQDNTSIFAKFHYSSDDSITAYTAESFKGDLVGLLESYPNLRDNMEGLGGAYLNQDKSKSILDSYGLPSETESVFSQNSTLGVYTPNTHQLAFDVSDPEQAFKNFAHEFGHAIDYPNAGKQGCAGNVSYNNYGAFSASKEFVNAFYQDLKNLQETDVARKYPKLVKELGYPLKDVDFSDGIDKNDLTVDGVRETFALLVSHILTGQDEKNGIAEVMPNTYALVRKKVATA